MREKMDRATKINPLKENKWANKQWSNPAQKKCFRFPQANKHTDFNSFFSLVASNSTDLTLQLFLPQSPIGAPFSSS
jgi:hypothetical protein